MTDPDHPQSPTASPADAQSPASPADARSAPRRTGSPCWIDLTTHDLDAARRFYGELFGWEFHDSGEDFGHYHQATKDGAVVAGAMAAMNPDGTPADPERMPAGWNVYLATDDAEAASAAIREHGGSVPFPAMDVGDLGRMAFAVDAAGAAFGLWQAGRFGGIDASGPAGTPVWFECMSGDALVAEQFYRDALGWDIVVMPGSSDDGFWYATNGGGDAASAGLCDASSFLPARSGGYWRMYIAVDDTDATIERLRELGGSVLDGPTPSPFGYLATVADPEGASFQIIQTSRPGDHGETERGPVAQDAAAAERGPVAQDAPAAEGEGDRAW